MPGETVRINPNRTTMNQVMSPSRFDHAFPSPLEPPGTVAIIAATDDSAGDPFDAAIALEAALYGRYLGYKVQVFGGGSIDSLPPEVSPDEALSMLPSQSHSPLAARAIATQAAGGNPAGQNRTGPLTMGDYVDKVLLPLSRSDLLRGVRRDEIVTAVDTQSVADDDAEDPDEIPPDFRLHFAADRESETFESVIMTADPSPIDWRCEIPAPYLFAVWAPPDEDAARRHAQRLAQIVLHYAALGDRPDLNLYLPARG